MEIKVRIIFFIGSTAHHECILAPFVCFWDTEKHLDLETVTTRWFCQSYLQIKVHYL